MKKTKTKKVIDNTANKTNQPKPSVLFCASECVPFVKTGGLADVIGALPKALVKMGVDVRVILPLFGGIPSEYRRDMRHVVDFEVEMGWRRQYCGIELIELNGIKFYFVDNRFYFDRAYIYGYGSDEAERFAFFARAVLNALPLVGFQPDILHCHDWQAGFIPALLKIQYKHLPFYAAMNTVMTIHNLQYQGIHDRKAIQDLLGLGDSLFTSDKLEYYGMANFLKAGIVYSDFITTVSPSYAEEIQSAYYGEKLDGLLRARHDTLFGILNGIDVEEYNPSSDNLIAKPFTVKSIEGKAECKAALRRELGLREGADAPIIALVTRLSSQKGLDLVDHVITQIMNTGAQLVVLGKGDAKFIDLFSWVESKHQGMAAARFEMNGQLAHRIYAGADMFLMPSQFEPCGLSQMIAMRYGTIPIVRETGGLRDTVPNFCGENPTGVGFVFTRYNAHDMLHEIERAVSIYNGDKLAWRGIMERAMSIDFSWDKSARDYLGLYEKLK